MTRLLGGLAPATFLRRHWQQRPLLVRQAVPGFAGILDRRAMLALAARGDAVSRLVIQQPDRWERQDGPFLGLHPSMLPATRWTLLVHGVESLVPGGWELLGRFGFIPAARVDDLMVSYAADGGSVGPHDDRYDVFLLQGPGRRRWQIQEGGARTADPRAAIRVLADFRPTDEWLLEPGDMLYLPPGVAHHGVADGPCFTYSIGFLAPAHSDLVRSFLEYLGPTLAAAVDPDALYADPDLAPTARPLELPGRMIDRVAAVLGGIRWDRGHIEDFLGRFLTMPRPHARFVAPARPLGVEAFARRLRRVELALPSRGLTRRGRLFLNGQSFPRRPGLERLLATRALAVPRPLPDRTVALLHDWYAAGWTAPPSSPKLRG